jgi:hypothetical protein
MVLPRHRLPTPAWAELPPTGSMGDEPFRPFFTAAFLSRIATPIGAVSLGSQPEALSIVHDDDSDAPQMDLL